ncbi:MAG: hypothetical protein ABIW83_01240 [Allosphingosinicella sp.]
MLLPWIMTRHDMMNREVRDMGADHLVRKALHPETLIGIPHRSNEARRQLPVVIARY